MGSSPISDETVSGILVVGGQEVRMLFEKTG
jgi:hypothetical protein